jgi:hypothetical protein
MIFFKTQLDQATMDRRAGPGILHRAISGISA